MILPTHAGNNLEFPWMFWIELSGYLLDSYKLFVAEDSAGQRTYRPQEKTIGA